MYVRTYIVAFAIAAIAMKAWPQSGPDPGGPGPPPGPPGFINGAYTSPSAAATRRDPARLPDFSGVWIRSDMGHPDQTKILPFMKSDAAAEWKRKIDAHDFTVPWSQCEPTAFPAMLTEMGLPFEILMTPGRVTLLAADGEVHRIYTDGSTHEHAPDGGTYFGNSVGHWNGSTLIAETIDLRSDNDVVMGLTAGTDSMKVTEQLRLSGADELQDDITVSGPRYLRQPYRYIQRFRRLRSQRVGEFVCSANNNRDNGSTLDLTPPPPQQRSR
jgi:hypothetical protein